MLAQLCISWVLVVLYAWGGRWGGCTNFRTDYIVLNCLCFSLATKNNALRILADYYYHFPCCFTS